MNKDIKWGAPISAKVMKSLDLSADTPVQFSGPGGPIKTYSRWTYSSIMYSYHLPADHEYYQRNGNMGKLIQAVRDGDIEEAQKYLPVDPLVLKARQICADVCVAEGVKAGYIKGRYDGGTMLLAVIATLKECGWEENQ